MEVLMGRERSQLSRALAGILTIVVAIGLVAYFHNTTKSKASDEKPKVTAALPAAAPAPAKETTTPQAPAPLVSSAPRTEVSISAAPITKPGPSGPGPATKPSAQPAVVSRTKASPAPLSGNPLADGKAKMDAGDLLNA